MEESEKQAKLNAAEGAAAVIRALMEKQGISVNELATFDGRSSSYISQVLHPGEHSKGASSTYSNIPSTGTYGRLASHMGYTLTWNVEPTPTETPGRLIPKRPQKEVKKNV